MCSGGAYHHLCAPLNSPSPRAQIGSLACLGQGPPARAIKKKSCSKIENVISCIPRGAIIFSVWAFKTQLQIRAGAEKSTDTRDIINRYRTLGITRSILRWAVASATRIGTLTNQNIEYWGRYYSRWWYPPTLTTHATGILQYREDCVSVVKRNASGKLRCRCQHRVYMP